MNARNIVIIGGGFSGASAAVQLARKIREPLAITIVEPARTVGPGLAYSTQDASFRLNAPSGAHSIDVADPDHFSRWWEASGLRERDPDALAPNGLPFARRRDFGRYLAETVQQHARTPNGTTIVHHRAHVRDIHFEGPKPEVTLSDDGTLEADQILLATGNPAPRRPAMLGGALSDHPAICANPLAEGLDRLPPDAHVLVLGAGLTALDMVSSLLHRGHHGAISVISRHGLRPQPQPPAVLSPPPDPPPPPIIPLDLLNGDLPPYAEADPLTAVGLLHGLRAHVRAVETEGEPWQAAFDALAFPLSRIWPRLPLGEKQRILRHLRPYYDAHRFRTPPMTDAAVQAAEQDGQVRYTAASLEALASAADGQLDARLRLPGGRKVTQSFNALVNCTGLDSGSALAGNPLLARLVETGRLVPHPTGLGVVTDVDCRVIGANGKVVPKLWIIGPPTTGMFGDPLGAFFISAQLHRIIPALAGEMAAKLY